MLCATRSAPHCATGGWAVDLLTHIFISLCLSLSAPVCSCLFLSVPVCSCLSLLSLLVHDDSVLVRLVGSEANEIAAGAAKKENYRVSADHVLQALEVRPNSLAAKIRLAAHFLPARLSTDTTRLPASRADEHN